MKNSVPQKTTQPTFTCSEPMETPEHYVFKSNNGNTRAFMCSNPASNYMFKVNNRNTRARSEICSKLTIKTPEQRYLILILIPYFWGKMLQKIIF